MIRESCQNLVVKKSFSISLNMKLIDSYTNLTKLLY